MMTIQDDAFNSAVITGMLQQELHARADDEQLMKSSFVRQHQKVSSATARSACHPVGPACLRPAQGCACQQQYMLLPVRSYLT